jgi:hypothetical protein
VITIIPAIVHKEKLIQIVETVIAAKEEELVQIEPDVVVVRVGQLVYAQVAQIMFVVLDQFLVVLQLPHQYQPEDVLQIHVRAVHALGVILQGNAKQTMTGADHQA